MTAGLFTDVPTDAEHAADLRAREADYTPRGVVRQVLRECLRVSKPLGCDGWKLHACKSGVSTIRDGYSWGAEWDLAAAEIAGGRPLRALDWCAGAGVWASEMRALCDEAGVPVHITAVELDERERPNLERWCDEVWISDFAKCPVVNSGRPPMFDLVIGNPAFSLLHGYVPCLLSVSKCVLVLHTIECLHRSRAGRDLARACPPRAQFDIGGSIKFRGAKSGADLRSYAAWLWLPNNRGPGWHRELLPDLPPEARAWTHRPGAEP